jgi:hypothetical protein
LNHWHPALRLANNWLSAKKLYNSDSPLFSLIAMNMMGTPGARSANAPVTGVLMSGLLGRVCFLIVALSVLTI